MKQSPNFLHLFLAALCLVSASLPSGAQPAVPMLINYQGELKSPSTGEPVADGTYEMLFRVYDVEFGGTPLWVGTHSSLNGNPVEVTGGVFHVVLGSGTGNSMDSSIFNGADRWLEIRIGMQTLEPRQRITSVAYSMIAENSRLLDGKESSEFAAAGHPHSGVDITSGSVAEGRIDSSIARDSEVDSKIANHGAIADAHHPKTTSFTELTDAAADSQIPTGIARDAEIMPTVLANDGTGSGLDADTIDGAESATLEESAEIDADIAAHTAVSDAHHTRYTNAEAVAAMGAKSDANPLNHDKTTSLPWGSITSIPAGFADDTDDDTTYSAGAGLNLAATTFSAQFAGSGAASTVARSDHDHHATYVNEGQANSVTSAMVADGTLNSADLNDGAVITSKILNLAVTTEKIANSAVTTEKIANGAIENVDVSGAAAIAGTKIDPDFGSQNIVTTGRIGAGTSSPATKLHVSGGMVSVYRDDGVTAGEHELARFERSETTSYPGIQLGYRANGVGVTGAYLRGVGAGGDLQFGAGAVPQAMTIGSGGNVGIGTTSPSGKFEVVTTPGQDRVVMGQGEIVTDNVAASTARYVVAVAGVGYWGLGKTHTGNNNFHIVNYASGGRWDMTIRNDNGNVGVGTTFPQEKLDVNGNARVAGDLTVVGTATFGGVTMGKIYLATSGTILSTDGGTRVLYWDATNSEIELTNTSGDWLDYWWQAQKGATTSGNSGATATGTSNVAIISGTNSNDYGFEIHFGQADSTEGWCSVWLQYANSTLVGHYIKY
ncbi:MAG: hypothetical protein Q8Q12_03565 [bacterium]|nr:hypothetical protein [bacterium]